MRSRPSRGELRAGALTVAICVGVYALGDVSHPERVTHQPDTTAASIIPREDVADGSAAACHATLRNAGVAFHALAPAQASGIAWPVMLTGPLAGLQVRSSAPGAASDFLDCRLARALLAWAPRLRERGVVGLTHLSMYRQAAVVGGTRHPSAHASGMAIDVGSLELQDGSKLDVLTDWRERARGADPCEQTRRDSARGRMLRELVCDAAARQLFQTVLTPHYDDSHANHVHLELTASEPYVH